MLPNKIQVILISGTLALSVIASRAQQITDADMPQAWQYTEYFDQTLPTEDDWWKTFADPTLDSLISIGIANNYDVLMAQRRIEIARQTVRQAQSAYFPSLSVSGGWTKSQTSGMTGRMPGTAMRGSYFDLGADMQWELDIFGKITARSKQSKAQFQATRAEYDATMVSLCAKIATNYFQLRAVQREIEVFNQHMASQDTILAITQARHKAGLASGLDVAQAQTTYYSTVASITSLKKTEAAAINALAVLIGQFPGDLPAQLRQPHPLHDYHQLVSVGVPMELLRRRPDVVEAECQLAANAAAIGIAKRDFLPTLTLSGSIGTSAHDTKNLFDKQSYSYAIAPTLSWTIFSGLSRKAALESAKQQMMASIDNYNLTLLTAVQEVDNAMSAYTNDLQYIDCLEQAVEAAEHALALSVALYKQGLTTFINVTNSQISYLQYSNELVLAKGNALTDLVSLYQALGGGARSDK